MTLLECSEVLQALKSHLPERMFIWEIGGLTAFENSPTGNSIFILTNLDWETAPPDTSAYRWGVEINPAAETPDTLRLKLLNAISSFEAELANRGLLPIRENLGTAQ